MNPFELQAELTRQWLALVGEVASTMLTACTTVARDASAAWGDALTPHDGNSARAAVSSFPGQTGMGAPSPLSFAPPVSPSALLFAPMLAFTPWGPLLTASWAPTSTNWTCPSPGLNPSAAFFSPLTPRTDIAEKIASNYRSASGHAVAAITAPSGATIAPRKYGQPWWQSPHER